MILNQYKHLLKIKQFVKIRCDEICSTQRFCMGEAGVSIGKKSSTKRKRKNGTKHALKKDEATIMETITTDASLKGISLKEEGSVIQATDVKIIDEPRSTQEQPKKEEDAAVNDFLIRNIMTFPLVVTVDRTEINPVEANVKKFPSVTTILSETMSFDARQRLEFWKKNMIESMGLEKFIAYQTATLNRGTRFHTALKNYLLGEDMDKITVSKELEGCWNSVKPMLADISGVKVVESDVFHPHLQYKGIIDCVACYKNTPHVIEWKQSEKMKKDLAATYDAPVQLTAYMGALPWCKKAELSAPVTRGLVVIAYYDGAPAEVFQMDLDFCQTYWKQWLKRVQWYWASRSPKLKKGGC